MSGAGIAVSAGLGVGGQVAIQQGIFQKNALEALTKALGNGRDLRDGERALQARVGMVEREIRRVVNNDLDKNLTKDLENIHKAAAPAKLSDQQALDRLVQQKTDELFKVLTTTGIKVGRDTLKFTPEALAAKVGDGSLADAMSAQIAARLDSHRGNKLSSLKDSQLDHLQALSSSSLRDKTGFNKALELPKGKADGGPSPAAELNADQKKAATVILGELNTKLGVNNEVNTKYAQEIVRELTNGKTISTDPKAIEAAVQKVLERNGMDVSAGLPQQLAEGISKHVLNGNLQTSAIETEIQAAFKKLPANASKEQTLDALFRTYNEIAQKNGIELGSQTDALLQDKLTAALPDSMKKIACSALERYTKEMAEGKTPNESAENFNNRHMMAVDRAKSELLAPERMQASVDKQVKEVMANNQIDKAYLGDYQPETINKAVLQTYEAVYKANEAKIQADPKFKEALDKEILANLKGAYEQYLPAEPQAFYERYSKGLTALEAARTTANSEQYDVAAREILGNKGTPQQVNDLTQKIMKDTAGMTSEQLQGYVADLSSKNPNEMLKQEQAKKDDFAEYQEFFKRMVYGRFEGERSGGDPNQVFGNMTDQEKAQLKAAYGVFTQLRNGVEPTISNEKLAEHRANLEAIVAKHLHQVPVTVAGPEQDNKITFKFGTEQLVTVTLTPEQKTLFEKAQQAGFKMYYDTVEKDFVAYNSKLKVGSSRWGSGKYYDNIDDFITDGLQDLSK